MPQRILTIHQVLARAEEGPVTLAIQRVYMQAMHCVSSALCVQCTVREGVGGHPEAIRGHCSRALQGVTARGQCKGALQGGTTTGHCKGALEGQKGATGRAERGHWKGSKGLLEGQQGGTGRALTSNPFLQEVEAGLILVGPD